MKDFSIDASNKFRVRDSGQEIGFSPKALNTFSRFRQVSRDSTEAGGLLFAKFDFPDIHIVKATEPSFLDRRSRSRINFSLRKRRSIVKREFLQGLHFIGEWHTHPEPNPIPSLRDLTSMRDLHQNSTHELNHFLMVIVGNCESDLRLWVSIHDSEKMWRLRPSKVQIRE